MAISPELFQLAMRRNREADKSYRIPKHFSESLPAELQVKDPANQEAFRTAFEPIKRRGQIATDIVQTKAQNQTAYEALQQAKQYRGGMKGALAELIKNQPELKNRKPGTIDLSDMDLIFNGKGGGGLKKGVTPQDLISRMKPMMRHHLTTFRLPGMPNSVTVNKTVAPLFRGFLHDLIKSGYNIQSLGSHNIREQASGSGLMSLHSYGLAIDINPTQNPFQDASGGMKENMPPGIARLAAKYGLVWGGGKQWQSIKDPMHFSIPYKNRL